MKVVVKYNFLEFADNHLCSRFCPVKITSISFPRKKERVLKISGRIRLRDNNLPMRIYYKTIIASMNVLAEGNKIKLEWSEVQEVKCEKDGLQIVYLRKGSEKSLKAYLVQADQAQDTFERIKFELNVEERLPESALPESVLRLLSTS